MHNSKAAAHKKSELSVGAASSPDLLNEINRMTEIRNHRFELMLEKARLKWHYADTDAEQKTRLDAGLCPQCYYLDGPAIAGNMFKDYICLSCKEVHSHPNTRVPQLCLKCSHKIHACLKCLADLDYKCDRKELETK